MLYIFEMANNHMGDVKHAKRIIDEFSDVANKYKISAGIKLQFRNLDTFIHKDFQHRMDLKYVKRFNETRLTNEQFKEIVDYIKFKNMLAVATPFDNDSISLVEELNLDILKVASCSVDDWPLLEEVSKINKKIIISTAGARLNDLVKVYNLFKENGRNFAFMHCVGEYPTPINVSNLDRIKLLKKEFPDIQIGFSTHESPLQKSMTPYAVAMGCTIIEKHVGVKTDEYSLNAYSLTPAQMEHVLEEIQLLFEASQGSSLGEVGTLNNLKRGVYLKGGVQKGVTIVKDDIYFAMPSQEGMLNASSYYEIIGSVTSRELKSNEGLRKTDIVRRADNIRIINEVKTKMIDLLEQANVTITNKDDIELSCHYGLETFANIGCTIISKINRKYCKKILVMLPNQSHPTHRHLIKEESFELLYGDCMLNLNNKKIKLNKGDPILINTNIEHSFSTENGCVIEEISTTHYSGDSVYSDPGILRKPIEDRKIKGILGS